MLSFNSENPTIRHASCFMAGNEDLTLQLKNQLALIIPEIVS